MTNSSALGNPAPAEAHNPPPTAAEPMTSPSKVELRADRLAYMADMIRELQIMASEAQCETLAGILGLAHAEANQKAALLR